jgi:hypothetical protein
MERGWTQRQGTAVFHLRKVSILLHGLCYVCTVHMNICTVYIPDYFIPLLHYHPEPNYKYYSTSFSYLLVLVSRPPCAAPALAPTAQDQE